VNEASAPQRILIVRLGAMGDILHAMPAFMRLRFTLPQAKFGWVVEERWSALLNSNVECNGSVRPLVDTIHIVNTRLWRKKLLKPSIVGEIGSAFQSLRKQKYDIAVDFQGAIKSSVIALLSGAPRRYGFAEPWEAPASLLYTNKVHAKAAHVIEQNLELATAVANQPLSPPRPIKTAFAMVSGKQFRDDVWASPYVLLNPGAGWGAKQWPAQRYAEVARALGPLGYRSLINFGPGEENLAHAVERESNGFAVARQFDIAQLRVVTHRASLFIGGDTGPLHLAAALKVPVVALFGPTDPARTGPYGTRSIVLRDPSSITSHKRNRETEAGLMNISAEQVIAAARQLLNEDQGDRA
jgi:lipopolysaccharide heptosyltransferase I